MGGFSPSAIPEPSGPRNRGQLASPAKAQNEAEAVINAVTINVFMADACQSGAGLTSRNIVIRC